MAAILNACRHPEVRNLFEFAFWTGLRTSELIALRWCHINFVTEEVSVEEVITRASKGKVEPPKSKCGIRLVTLRKPALDALKRQKQHSFLQGEYVFLNPTTRERFSGDDSIREDHWKPTLKKAGVRYRKPYMTRHTFASMMLMSGETPLWVQRQMGHETLEMIYKHYAKWIPTEDRGEGKRAVEMFHTPAEK
ncbi:site-specific integrase [Kistimonas scapharcae]|uniref:site-specific integrase n=1 Tax=Kistimonas scapharcae TaxID=1036133 RepID=UPI0031ED5D50